MFKHNWIVYAVTDNSIKGIEAHKLEVSNATKRQAINEMYNHLNQYSFRNIVKVIVTKLLV